MMQANKKHAAWKPMYTVALLGLLGAVLIIAALYQPDSEEPLGWVALNRQVNAALSPEGAVTDSAAVETALGGKKVTESDKTVQTPAPARPGGNALPPAEAEAGMAADGGSQQTAVQEPAVQEPAGADAAEAAGVGAESEKAAQAITQDMSVTADGKININRASAAELDELPGIGAAKAKAIVAEREKNGPFRSVDDLLRVKGIGPKLLEKMKPSIVVIR